MRSQPSIKLATRQSSIKLATSVRAFLREEREFEERDSLSNVKDFEGDYVLEMRVLDGCVE